VLAMILGFLFSSVCLTPLIDIYGRRELYIWSTYVSVFSLAVLSFASDFNVALVCIFIFGLTAVPRLNMATIYPYEFTTKEHEKTVFVYFQFAVALVCPFLANIFQISQNMLFFLTLNYLLTAFFCLFVAF